MTKNSNFTSSDDGFSFKHEQDYQLKKTVSNEVSDLAGVCPLLPSPAMMRLRFPICVAGRGK